MQAAAAAGPGEETTGASTSWGLPARVPAPHHEPQEAPGLNQLPIEMLQEVLSYLPPSTLLRHCRRCAGAGETWWTAGACGGASCPGNTPTCGPSSAPACPLLTPPGPASWAASASADP